VSQNAYDWNRQTGAVTRTVPLTVQDETMRDGIQSPSATDPSIEDKIDLLHRMAAVGIDVVNIGLPAASQRNRDDVLTLCREIVSSKLPLVPAAAARTVISDVTAIIDASQAAGMAIEVYTFIGSSPIRQLAESWDLDIIMKKSGEAIGAAARAGLSVCYVTEDTTRSRPEVLATLFRNAIDHGAKRLCLADTVGHATPDGVRNLVGYVKSLLSAIGRNDIGIDGHGNNDRGLVLENALTAIECGADRIHGTALGVGERVGNAPMELLLLNLSLLGARPPVERELLASYCASAAKALHWQVPRNHPVADHA
jgi:2-isopropylmalate synthase